jgi:hypothetical protein
MKRKTKIDVVAAVLLEVLAVLLEKELADQVVLHKVAECVNLH